MDREDVLPTPPTGPALPTVLAERYQLDRSLGNGGMGEVFEATDLTLHRNVAVKLLSPSLVQDEPARARFLREARALARVNSPHVVTVYDAGEDDERPYLVMEFVEGATLEHELERAGRLEPPRAVAIAKDIASGLASAHEQGIVHRDIKQANMEMIAEEIGTGEHVRILDFGLARLRNAWVDADAEGPHRGGHAELHGARAGEGGRRRRRARRPVRHRLRAVRDAGGSPTVLRRRRGVPRVSARTHDAAARRLAPSGGPCRARRSGRRTDGERPR